MLFTDSAGPPLGIQSTGQGVYGKSVYDFNDDIGMEETDPSRSVGSWWLPGGSARLDLRHQASCCAKQQHRTTAMAERGLVRDRVRLLVRYNTCCAAA